MFGLNKLKWAMLEAFTVNSSHIVFLSLVFKTPALSPLFLSFSFSFLIFPTGCRCERVRPWNNIWFQAWHEESIEWPLHLDTQWQMDLQFSTWLSNKKANFHFHWEALRVQASSVTLFEQAAKLTLQLLLNLRLLFLMNSLCHFHLLDNLLGTPIQLHANILSSSWFDVNHMAATQYI